jgi:hypothetical protein
LLLAAFVSVLLQVYPFDTLRLGEGDEVTAVAKNLALEGEFANPFHALRTGPTAHVSPVYPLYLTAIFRAFGFTAASAFTVVGVLMAMHVVYPLLLFAAGRKLFDSGNAGLMAAGFAIVWPTFPVITESEYIFSANALLLVCLLTFDWRTAGRFGLGRSAVAGVVCGAMALLTATTVMISFPWFGYLYLRSNRKFDRAVKAAALFGMGFLAALSPWAIRNQMVLGAPILFRSNLGLELALSNNPRAEPTQSQNSDNGSYTAIHANFSGTEASKLLSLGEVAYNRQRLADALSWIQDHPYEFSALTAKRVLYYWLPLPGEYVRYAYRTWLLSPLALAGLVLLFRRREPLAWFFAASLFLFPLTLYLIHVSLRLRLPAMWMEVLLTGYALVTLWETARRLRAIPDLRSSDPGRK